MSCSSRFASTCHPCIRSPAGTVDWVRQVGPQRCSFARRRLPGSFWEMGILAVPWGISGKGRNWPHPASPWGTPPWCSQWLRPSLHPQLPAWLSVCCGDKHPAKAPSHCPGAQGLSLSTAETLDTQHPSSFQGTHLLTRGFIQCSATLPVEPGAGHI